MIKYILFTFTVICKPGGIYDNEMEQVVDLQYFEKTKETFYFEDIELESGVYLYLSQDREDSVFFLIEGDEIEYLYTKANNEDFLILK